MCRGAQAFFLVCWILDGAELRFEPGVIVGRGFYAIEVCAALPAGGLAELDAELYTRIVEELLGQSRIVLVERFFFKRTVVVVEDAACYRDARLGRVTS